MGKPHLCLMWCVLVTWLYHAEGQVKPSSPETLQLAGGLYGELAALSDNTTNICISPTGVALALRLALCGEGDKAAGRHDDIDTSSSIYLESTKDDYTLVITNGVVIGEDRKELSQCIEPVTGAVFVQDGKQEKEEFEDEVNAWFAEHTNQKLKRMVSDDDGMALDYSTLINAVYFHGNWSHSFKRRDTEPRPFFLNDSNSIDIDMMYVKGVFDYSIDKPHACKVLRIPYSGNIMSMYVILPNSMEDFKSLEKKLRSGMGIRSMLADLKPTPVELVLPKFKVIQTVDLKPALESMGELDKLHVLPAHLWQKVFIEVDEGSEKNVDDNMDITNSSNPAPDEVLFLADRPFFFAVMDTADDIPFIVGRLVRPVDFTPSTRRGDQEDGEYYYYYDYEEDGCSAVGVSGWTVLGLSLMAMWPRGWGAFY